MSAGASGTGAGATGASTGFMSEYMSGLNQSQDHNSFLQRNQPAYDPSLADSHAHHTNTSSPSADQARTTPAQDSSSTKDSAKARRPFDEKTPVGSHPLPNAHAYHQKHAIQTAALDNCADLNVELTDCLLGKAGTWWDRASMCMKAKERFGTCCRLNKELLQEKGYAREGNTLAQDRAILDYADKATQEAMKEEKS